MNTKTNNKHPDFGVVHVGNFRKDSPYFYGGTLKLRQLNERIDITLEQAVELVEILQEAIKQEQQNER